MKYIKKGIAPLFFFSTLVLAGKSAPKNKTSQLSSDANTIAKEITNVANSAAKEITDTPNAETADAIAAFAIATINEHVKQDAAADTIRRAAMAGVNTINDAAKAKLRQ